LQNISKQKNTTNTNNRGQSLKRFAIGFNQHLNSHFYVSCVIKPGAKTNQLFDTQEDELKSLKRRFLIVSTGTNDIDNPTTNINNIITPLITYIDKFEHTNILIINIPIRYDLGLDFYSISKKRRE
jgi:hypothetical protein